jgi:hypothetical protein
MLSPTEGHGFFSANLSVPTLRGDIDRDSA